MQSNAPNNASRVQLSSAFVRHYRIHDASSAPTASFLITLPSRINYEFMPNASLPHLLSAATRMHQCNSSIPNKMMPWDVTIKDSK